MGRLRDALAVIVVLLLVPLFFRWPLSLVFIYLVVSTNLLETLPLQTKVMARLGPGLSFTAPDLVLLVMLVVSLVRLRNRRERPMFLGFVVLWTAYVVFQAVYGAIVGETGLDLLTNMAQAQVGWLLYLMIVGLIDSPRDLRIYGWFFLAIMAVAVVYQVAEYAHGGRIVLVPAAASRSNYFTFTPTLKQGGITVPYLWSRANEVTCVGFFLAFAAALGGRRFFPYGVLAAAGLLSVVLTQIRQMYLGVAIGMLVVLAVGRWRARTPVRIVALLAVLVVAVAVVSPLVSASFGGDPVGAWSLRVSQLVNYDAQANFAKRLDDARAIREVVKGSPVFGFGWGTTYLNTRGESAANVFLLHGYLGTFMILAMFVTVLAKALRLAWRLRPSLEEAWLFGLVGAAVALAVGPDAFASGGFAVMVAVFVDRISAFEADGRLWEPSASGLHRDPT